MYVVLVDWRTRPEQAEAFAALLTQQARNSLENEPACRVFDVARDPETPGRYLLYEVYDDRAGFEAHVRTPHYATFAAAIEPFSVAKDVRFLDRIAG